MQIPTILRENVTKFLQNNSFDLYVGNPFSAKFFPNNAKVLILKRTNYSDLVKFKKAVENNARILAFGAGSVIDAAKYIASITKSNLTIILSALSVNSFSTHRSSFFLDKLGKKSFNTVVPDTILIDFNLLRSAGILNDLGIMELASTATAQTDWSLAIKRGLEKDNVDLRKRARTLIFKAIDLLNGDTSSVLEELFEGLLESGSLTQAYGNGRPVSGSEHIISSYIENEIECAHGAALYILYILEY